MPSEYLIVANGDFLSENLLQKLSDNKIILALDGAADRLKKLDIQPSIILGDFDSIENLEDWKKNSGIQIVHAPDQDKTDLFKALDYIKPFEPASIHLACAYSSSRMDHTLNNLRALRVFYQKNCPIYFYTEHQKIFFDAPYKNKSGSFFDRTLEALANYSAYDPYVNCCKRRQD